MGGSTCSASASSPIRMGPANTRTESTERRGAEMPSASSSTRRRRNRWIAAEWSRSATASTSRAGEVRRGVVILLRPSYLVRLRKYNHGRQTVTSTSADLFEAIEQGERTRGCATILAADPTLAATRGSQGVSALMRARYRIGQGPDPGGARARGRTRHVRGVDLRRSRPADRAAGLRPRLGGASARGTGSPRCTSPPSSAARRSPRSWWRAASQVDAHGTGWMTGTPLHSAASSDHVDVVAGAAGCGRRSPTPVSRAGGRRCTPPPTTGARRW